MEENQFLKYYNDTKNNLEKYIDQFNKEILKEENNIIKGNLKQFANLNSDGKLIRGVLVNLGYKMIKEESNYSYPLALAFEVFQTSVLIHDDIIDNDNLRRGKTTIHAYNYDKYYKLTKSSKSKTLADNLAICVGDLGFYKSNYIISNSYKDDSNLGAVLNYYNEVVINTIRGEILDVALPFNEEFNLGDSNLENNILEIYKLKTAYYTIVGPLSLGMILGGANKERLKDIEKIGYNLGIAFQLQDDLLGIYGDEIGKPVGSDIEEFKQTLLYAYTKKNRKYYDELLKVYGKKLNEKNLLKVRKIFQDSGAYTYTQDMINKLYEESIKELNEIDWLRKEDKIIIEGFIQYLKNRRK